jgi:hypothetical protein
MATFYDIARKTRNALPYMDEYRGGIGSGRARNTAPVGMTQGFIEPDYYIPDDLAAGGGSYWFENEDPEATYGSFSQAVAATGGDPNKERQAIVANNQQRLKLEAAKRDFAMKLLQEQRMRENNRLRAMSQAQSRAMSYQARQQDLAERKQAKNLSAYGSSALGRYSQNPTSANKTKLLSGYARAGGTPEQLDAFSFALDQAARREADYQTSKERQAFTAEKESASRVADYLKSGDQISWDASNISSSTFSNPLKTSLEAEAREWNTIQDSREVQANNVLEAWQKLEDSKRGQNESQLAVINNQQNILRMQNPYFFDTQKEGKWVNPFTEGGGGRYQHRWDIENLFNKDNEPPPPPPPSPSTPITSPNPLTTSTGVQPTMPTQPRRTTSRPFYNSRGQLVVDSLPDYFTSPEERAFEYDQRRQRDAAFRDAQDLADPSRVERRQAEEAYLNELNEDDYPFTLDPSNRGDLPVLEPPPQPTSLRPKGTQISTAPAPAPAPVPVPEPEVVPVPVTGDNVPITPVVTESLTPPPPFLPIGGPAEESPITPAINYQVGELPTSGKPRPVYQQFPEGTLVTDMQDPRSRPTMTVDQLFQLASDKADQIRATGSVSDDAALKRMAALSALREATTGAYTIVDRDGNVLDLNSDDDAVREDALNRVKEAFMRRK